eukprot:m.46447 g.46447  ORF g.46447 m.46447 type:complete len:341 (-) comp13152_c0_seq2:70-1092(-)
MAIPDARINKLLTAFKLQHCWPALQQAGVRNIIDLAQMQDASIMNICAIPLPVMHKMRGVLNKVLAAKQQQRASAAAPASQRNPFGDPAPPPRPAQPKTPSRVLNLAPSGGAPPAVPTAARPTPGNGHRRAAPAPPSAPRPGNGHANTVSLPGPRQAAVAPSRPAARKPHKAQPRRMTTSVTADVVDPAVVAKAMPIVVHEGYAIKCGGKVKSWQRRYFILRADGTLTYAKEGSLTVPKGVIPLKDAVTVHGPGNCNWSAEDKVPKDATPMLRFEIVLPERTYKLYCDNQQAAAEWANKLDKVKQHCLSTPTLPAPKQNSTVMQGYDFQLMLAELGAVNK